MPSVGLTARAARAADSRAWDVTVETELFAHFEILSNEVRFFDHRHWGVLGRLAPDTLRRALGRRWGWHRIVHARKAPAERRAVAERGALS